MEYYYEFQNWLYQTSFYQDIKRKTNNYKNATSVYFT